MYRIHWSVSTMAWRCTFALQCCSITRFWELVLSSFRFVVSVALAWAISSTVNSRSSSCFHEFKVDWSFIVTIFWKIKVACWLLRRFNSNTVGCATLCMTLDWINKGFALSTFSSDIAEGFGEGTAEFSCESASYIVVTSQSAYAITVPRSCLMTY